MANRPGSVHRPSVGCILRPLMPCPTPTRPRPRSGRPGVRALVMLVGAALLLPPRPVQASAPATQACPTDVDAVPPLEVLALKNAGQELRAAGSYSRASRVFREAAEELPNCATFADERLRWALWAAETAELAGLGADVDVRAFLERQVALVGASPEGRALGDYPQLIDARDRRPPAPEAARPDAPAAAPRRATRVGAALMAGGAPLVLTGAVLTGVFHARDRRISDQLGGATGLDALWAAGGCTAAARPDEPASCADLRGTRGDLRGEGLINSRGLITGVTLIGVGAALLLAGLVTHVQGRRAGRRLAELRLRPARAGLVLGGRF